MQNSTFFPYSWHIDDNEEDITAIRIYGINEQKENVCLRINNFTPFIYLELPDNIPWTASKAQLLGNKLDSLLGDRKPIVKNLIYKHKLYYASIIKGKKTRKTFPYLFCSFSTVHDIKNMSYKIRASINVIGIGLIKLKMHEQDASPILQFISYRCISTAGWIDFNGKEILPEDKITFCEKEYIVKWKNVKANESSNVAVPLILGFDIEVNSTNPSAMPKAEKPGDKIFQISCILCRNGSNDMKKYLLSLGEPDSKIVGESVEIQMFETEHDLIIGFTEFLQEHNPNIIMGYNILNFDIPYMIERAKLNYCIDIFDQLGFTKNKHSEEKTIRWSSSAYGQQTFQFLDAEGRLFVDLLPLIKRDYKLNNYKLKTVSSFFLGDTKKDLTPKGIFKCYRIGIQNVDGVYSEKSKKAMGICGSYCMKDSELVILLFNKLQIWIGLCEMAKTCNVPIFYLYTQGQQIRVYSQIYKYCLHNNFVVEKDGYITKDDEHYIGATVIEPVAGIYEKVVPFDFSSLYPNTIIAYNIDYSTLVPENSIIPDTDCHILEWVEHQGCEHDKTVRKIKPKYILCGNRKLKFVKEPKGVMPTVLENLLSSRKKTRDQIKILKNIISKNKISHLDYDNVKILISNLVVDEITPENISYLKLLIEVLDKRQLAYKVSANSMYGSMGVSRGYLPFMPGAMATTAMGRKNILIAIETIEKNFNGKLVYSDTDSAYVMFKDLNTSEEIWDYALYVSKEVSKVFPPPLYLEFENAIYWRFFILTKKRYMYKKCCRDGKIEEEVGNKGVLLARRDNSPFIREIYATVINMVFNIEPRDNILMYILEEIQKLCSNFYFYKKFIVTKAVGDIGENIIHFQDEKTKKMKGKMGSYKVPLLSTEVKERTRQFKLKDCNNEKEYYIRCLPAVVQLAERMRDRGQRVDIGTRLEYVISTQGGHKAKQYIKIEDATYFGNHSSVLKIDFLYYLKLMVNPFDDIFNILYYNQDTLDKYKFKKNFVLNQYKFILNIKTKLHDELINIFKPKIMFVN